MLILDHITRLQNSKGVNSLLYCSATSVRSNMIKIVVKPADNGQVTTIRRLGSCPWAQKNIYSDKGTKHQMSARYSVACFMVVSLILISLCWFFFLVPRYKEGIFHAVKASRMLEHIIEAILPSFLPSPRTLFSLNFILVLSPSHWLSCQKMNKSLRFSDHRKTIYNGLSMELLFLMLRKTFVFCIRHQSGFLSQYCRKKSIYLASLYSRVK